MPSNYYDAETEASSVWFDPPSCRAIMHSVDRFGDALNYDGGNVGGGTVASWHFGGGVGSWEPRTTLRAVFGDIEALNVSELITNVLDSPECTVVYFNHKLIDYRTEEFLKMPDGCAEGDHWQENAMNTEARFSVAVPIAGVIGWYLARTMILRVEFQKDRLKEQYEAIVDEAGLDPKWAVAMRVFIMFGIQLYKWIASVMVSPINGLRVLDSCPQVVTARYSSFYVMGTVAAFALAEICRKFENILQSRRREDRLGRCGKLVLVTVYFSLLAIVLVHFGYTIFYYAWHIEFPTLIFNFHFELNWPEFRLANAVCVYQALSFALWLLDLFIFLYDSAGRGRRLVSDS